MFSGLLIVRLRAAERAFKEGRLDEAFRLVTAPDLRGASRAAALLSELTEAFIGRAKTHFAEERFAEALNDLNKAEAGGVRLDKIAELRQNIRVVASEVNRQEASRRRRIEQAKERIEAGSLAAGHQILAGAGPSDVVAQELAADIHERQGRALEGFAQIQKMINDGQLVAAIERFKKVKPLAPQAAEGIVLESAIASQVVAHAREALEAGRISRAVEEMGLLGALGQSLPARRDFEDLIELAQAASQALTNKDFENARRSVLRLQGLLGKTGWVETAADQLAKIDDLLTALYGGPLGEPAHEPVVPANLQETVLLKDRAAPGRTRHRSAEPVGALPDRLLLLVDGGGSYLVIRKDRATIGRAITRHQPDVPIRSDLAERHAEIARVQDDYFLLSSHDVEVDGRATRHHLLRNDNRISLARNARFTFRMPHRQSPSGLLEMSSTTHLPNDVRHVILFRETAMIGFGKNVHVVCRSAVHGLILFERGGRLWVRPQQNGRIDTEAIAVEIGTQMELFNVSFVVEPWTVPKFGPAFS